MFSSDGIKLKGPSPDALRPYRCSDDQPSIRNCQRDGPNCKNKANPARKVETPMTLSARLFFQYTDISSPR